MRSRSTLPHRTRPHLWPLLVVALLALGAACGDADDGLDRAQTAPPTVGVIGEETLAAAPDAVTVRIGDEATIEAETARTGRERAQGLSGRDSMGENAGMLFLLGEERVPTFTMNEMRFPLDFVWISSDLMVADLTEDVPHPDATGGTITQIRPDVPAFYVLELNAGTIERLSISIGDEVRFEPDLL